VPNIGFYLIILAWDSQDTRISRRDLCGFSTGSFVIFEDKYLGDLKLRYLQLPKITGYEEMILFTL
jgi:hypothetical protein